MLFTIELEINEQPFDCDVEADCTPGYRATSSEPGCGPQVDDILSCKLLGNDREIDIWPALDSYVRGIVRGQVEEQYMESLASAHDDAMDLRGEEMRDRQLEGDHE